MPQLDQDVWQPWADSGQVEAFAISSSVIGAEDPADLAQYVQGLGLTMTVLADYEASVYEAYRFQAPEAFAPYPREYVIGKDGRIAYLSATLDVAAVAEVVEAEVNK